MTASGQKLYSLDLDLTLRNRARLLENSNLMHWYRELYQQLFSRVPQLEAKRILEIGSGTSPLKTFCPEIITSDILQLDYLDHVFDCHEIDRFKGVREQSLDIIVLVNVLHHLRDPILFLQKATHKLAEGGEVYLVEPYFSAVSTFLYRFLHPEPVRFGISHPVLDKIEGPLSTANQAIPFMIFFSHPQWRAALADVYDLNRTRLEFFSGLSYMMTGGISRRIPIPARVYRAAFSIDQRLARSYPRLFASFFIARLVSLGNS